MLDYLKANFDLEQIIQFSYNVQNGVLTVQGVTELGKPVTKTTRLSRIDAARLFRLYVSSLPGLEIT